MKNEHNNDICVEYRQGETGEMFYKDKTSKLYTDYKI